MLCNFGLSLTARVSAWHEHNPDKTLLVRLTGAWRWKLSDMYSWGVAGQAPLCVYNGVMRDFRSRFASTNVPPRSRFHAGKSRLKVAIHLRRGE
jgi:hypothetical protein